MSSYIPSSSSWASQKYLPSSTGYSSHSDAGRLRVVIDRSYDASTNKSTLTFRLQCYSEDYSGTFRVRQGGTLKVNGSTIQTFEQGSTSSTHFVVTDKDDTWRYFTKGTQTTATWSKTLAHDSEGKLTVTVATDFWVYYKVGDTSYVMRWVNSGSVSFSEPRGSKIASITSSVETGGSVAISMTRAVSSYYHKATFKVGSTTLLTTGLFGASTSVTVPRSWLTAYPNNASLAVTVSIQTYTSSAGTTAVGDPATATVTVKPDSGMAPSIAEGFAAAAPSNTGAVAGLTGYIQSYSKAQITLDASKITLQGNATISSYAVTCQGSTQTGTGTTFLTAVLTGAAAITITVKVTDSRGLTASTTLTVTPMAYAAPTITALTVERCDSQGNADEDGQYVAVTATGNFSPLDQQNVLTMAAQYKQGSSGSYGTAESISSGVKAVLGGGILDPDQKLTVQISATDRLGNTASALRVIPTRIWAMKFRADGLGVAFGKAPEFGQKKLELPEDWCIMNGTETRLPILMGTAAEASNAAVVRAALGLASGTSNGWTYYRIGTICFAWYYKQLTGVDITASWSGLYYRSGEIEAAPYPTFLANGYKFSAALAGGSQNGGVTLGRIMNSNSALRVYLMATGSVTSANCAVMVFVMGTWKE